MAAISLSPNLPRNPNRFVSSHRKHRLQYRLSFASSFFPFSSAFLHKSSSSHNQTRRSVPFRVSALNNSTDSHSFDIVVIGAGIIGLTIARQLLLHSDLSVAVVDAAVPCAGATGAGILCCTGYVVKFNLYQKLYLDVISVHWLIHLKYLGNETENVI